MDVPSARTTHMDRYRPAVAWTHIVLGAATLLPALILPLVFGGVWSLVALGAHDPQATAIVGVTFGVVLAIVLTVLAISGGLSLAAGVGLLRGKAWGEVLTIIASVLHLANFPLGTSWAPPASGSCWCASRVPPRCPKSTRRSELCRNPQLRAVSVGHVERSSPRRSAVRASALG